MNLKISVVMLFLLTVLAVPCAARELPVDTVRDSFYGSISAGSGMHEGDEFLVFRKGVDIGRFLIQKVRPKTSTGVFIPDSTEAFSLKKGDMIAIPDLIIVSITISMSEYQPALKSERKAAAQTPIWTVTIPARKFRTRSRE